MYSDNNNKIELELKNLKILVCCDLPSAFKNLWINMSLEDSSNWDQLINLMPNGAEDGDIELPSSNIFSDIVSDINQDEITKLQKVIKDQNEAPGVRERARLKLEFWEIYLPKALDTTIGAGTYDKLIQLKNELKVTV